MTIVKGAAKSTVGGSVTMTNLPPISTDGQQNGPCTTDTQTFGLGPGNVVNPGAGGVNSANGVWNLTVAGDGTLSGSLTVQDKGKSGFFSEFTFTATR